MDEHLTTKVALLWASGIAREYGSAVAALAALGIDLTAAGSAAETSEELGALLARTADDPSVLETLALGVLAGPAARQRPRTRRFQDPTAFLLDVDLVVQDGQGESILRLPWFDEELFVGRQFPEISEIPRPILKMGTETYTAALKGRPGHYAFTSYGHSYSVDAHPVRNEAGKVHSVLVIAKPATTFESAARAYERTAERLERHAASADERAARYCLADHKEAEAVERERAREARRGAQRAWANSHQLRSRHAVPSLPPPAVTPREADVLALASHGLRSAEIADQLRVSVTTVKTHFDNIYAKLGVSDRTAAVAIALRHGLID